MYECICLCLFGINYFYIFILRRTLTVKRNSCRLSCIFGFHICGYQPRTNCMLYSACLCCSHAMMLTIYVCHLRTNNSCQTSKDRPNIWHWSNLYPRIICHTLVSVQKWSVTLDLPFESLPKHMMGSPHAPTRLCAFSASSRQRVLGRLQAVELFCCCCSRATTTVTTDRVYYCYYMNKTSQLVERLS